MRTNETLKKCRNFLTVFRVSSWAPSAFLPPYSSTGWSWSARRQSVQHGAAGAGCTASVLNLFCKAKVVDRHKAFSICPQRHTCMCFRKYGNPVMFLVLFLDALSYEVQGTAIVPQGPCARTEGEMTLKCTLGYRSTGHTCWGRLAISQSGLGKENYFTAWLPASLPSAIPTACLGRAFIFVAQESSSLGIWEQLLPWTQPTLCVFFNLPSSLRLCQCVLLRWLQINK